MSFWATFWMNLCCIAAGYVTAVFTWDWVHTKWVGVETKIAALQTRIRVLRGTQNTTGL